MHVYTDNVATRFRMIKFYKLKFKRHGNKSTYCSDAF